MSDLEFFSNFPVSIKLVGLGGQGVVTAAAILARAAFQQGLWSQSMPFFGVERTGTPVEAYIKIGRQPIRDRQKIDQPDILLINDVKLFNRKQLGKFLTIVNQPEQQIVNQRIGYDSRQVSLDILGKDLAIGLLGGLAAVWPQISQEAWLRALKEHFTNQVLFEINTQAFQANFSLVEKLTKYQNGQAR
ncbi:MAG TPA: 2-oxoacid:acceptor oxidoreductase family protein [bacterium]|nr:2-oxoacid:acceptor oxidoreductase family protein [bacterium]